MIEWLVLAADAVFVAYVFTVLHSTEHQSHRRLQRRLRADLRRALHQGRGFR